MMTKNILVLLVEDNPGDARLVQEMLSDINTEQYDVIHCTNLDQAVQNLKQCNLDIVLLDLSLPDAQKLDSLTLLNEMFPNIPVVVLSGLDDESLALEAVQNGAQDYLVKGHSDGNLLNRALRYSIERKHAEVNLAYLAQYDHLTKLPNRILLQDRMDQALAQIQRDKELVAVLFLDLDRFKGVNDSLGHNIGDMLLIEVADRLKTCIRKADTIARFGGDEFIIILSKIHEASTVASTAQKIIEVLEHPFQISGNEIFITTSTGIAIYPGSGEDSNTLIRNADSAMYRAKEMGRNNYQFFTPEMNIMAQKRLEIERELRHALGRNEFELYYQPQVDLKTGQVSGLEALLRWNHPKAGMLLPAQFIGVLEETGLIVPIGEWVLETACAQNRKWQECGLSAHKIAVNLSARQFSHSSLVEMIASVLGKTGLAPEFLELEITEGLLMEHTQENNATLSELKKMGIIISIDDFGTGYSSLSYLKRFPLDTLKIDRSFVMDVPNDLDSVAIVQAIIAMAHSLRLRVIAEGVETVEQLEFLRLQQCDEIQGYLICKPASAHEIHKFLEKNLSLEQRLQAAAKG